MTVIAWDGRTLAADTCVTISGTRTRFGKKLRRFANGDLAAMCGNVEACMELMSWLETGDESEIPEILGKGDVLVVRRSGGVFVYGTKHCVPIEISEEKYSMGSGGDIAMGAMMHGASAKTAVRYAIERDPGCGFDVAWLTLRRDHVEPAPEADQGRPHKAASGSGGPPGERDPSGGVAGMDTGEAAATPEGGG